MKERNLATKKAVITLLFLSPITAELLSGSAPPVEFFNPFGLMVLVALYGCGAIILRELKIRWHKGYGALLVLGAAYGIIEEGLMVKSFFDPNWMDLGILGVYGRWFSVNWVWSVELTIYHSVVSIVIPIVLVELMYPEIKSRSWVKTKTLKILTIIFISDVIFGYMFLTTYFPPISLYLATLMIVLVLFYVAYRFPESLEFNGQKIPPSPRKLWLIGLLWFIVYWLIIFNMLPYTGIPPAITIILGILAFILPYRYFRRFNWKSDIHKLALVSGVLSFLIFLAPLQEMDKTRPDNPVGMTLVGIAYTIFLLYMKRRIKSAK